MTLVIQTNTRGRLHVWVCDQRGVVLRHRQRVVQWHGAEYALRVVDSCLADQSLTPRRLRRILVVRGPGAFSAVRVGLVLANTFSYILHIPIRGVRSESQLTEAQIRRLVSDRSGYTQRAVRPWYGKEPNISRPKRR